MTDKEKAKAYDEAFERASAAHKDEDRHLKATLERIFPELKEDDGERIKKELIQWVDEFPDTIWRGHYKKDIIAWLEKQRKPKSYWKPTEEQYEALDYAYNSCPDTERGNYYEGVLETLIEDLHMLEKQGKKSTDKIESRFNVGDWVVFITSGSIYQVEKKENYEYTLKNIHGGLLCVDFSNEELIRKWTIEDAEDGDVLEFEDHGRFVIGILSFVNKTTGKVDVSCLLECNKFKVGVFYNLDTVKPHPATKEQRDSLMKAMNDAGYEWDAEKKELNTKKINLKK